MALKGVDALSFQEAMGNLAAIMEINMDDPPSIAIVKKVQITIDKDAFGLDAKEWLAGEGPDSLLDVLDVTHRAIYDHLVRLKESPEIDWTKEKNLRGVRSIMALVGESAAKLEAYLAYRLGEPLLKKIISRPDYKAIERFYKSAFKTEEGEEWEEEAISQAPHLDKDFQSVKQDKEYELFYIRNEEGEPYFSPELLRNIKVALDFSGEAELFEEDPLLKVRALRDKDLHASASQILAGSESLISEFYKISRSQEGNHLVKALSQSVLALLLAANPRYLLPNTTGKSCLQYFEDFHHFLRASLSTPEYQKLIAYPPEKSDRVDLLLLHLAHSLCQGLFESRGGIKQETIGLIHRCMRHGDEIKQKKKKHIVKGDTLWNQLLIDDEKFREFLSKFPSGPLFKTLDIIRESQEEEAIVPFDPIGQENLPCMTFRIERKGLKTDVLRLPCPTRQGLINKAEIIDEFKGFLHALDSEKPPRKLLLVNLQDRNSWKEIARSNALESLQKNAEFVSDILILTLPKDSDFYYQIGEYLELNQAEDFIHAFKAELSKKEEGGFFFPHHWKESERNAFFERALHAIHVHFFAKKGTLGRKQREDFIEIFYQFLILKCIDFLEPGAISFTCKDAIDTGSVQMGAFYAFLKLLLAEFTKREEHEFFRWLTYAPALCARERPTDPERVARALSLLEQIDKEKKEIKQTFKDLFHPQMFKSLEISE